jgi:haloalkane dehalogenase
LVPTSLDDPASADNVAAWEVLSRFERPFLCAFSNSDPVTAGGDAPFKAKIPGAQGQPHTTIAGGGHFLQEDCGPTLAQVILDFIDPTP